MLKLNRKKDLKKLLFGLFLILAGIGIIFWGAKNLDESNNNVVLPSVNLRAAPNFYLERLGDEKTLLKLRDLKGKPVVLSLWTTECVPCTDTLSDFARLQEELQNEVTFIAINRGEKTSEQIEFLERNETLSVKSLTFLVDAADSYYPEIQGVSMPETLFLNTEGKIVEQKGGHIDLNELRNKATKLVN